MSKCSSLVESPVRRRRGGGRGGDDERGAQLTDFGQESHATEANAPNGDGETEARGGGAEKREKTTAGHRPIEAICEGIRGGGETEREGEEGEGRTEETDRRTSHS